MSNKAVKFVYINDLKFIEPFAVKQINGSLLIDNEFIERVLLGENIHNFHVFSFDRGILLIFDYFGNCMSIVPSSGIVDANGLMKCLLSKISNTRIGYGVDEFYRMGPEDMEYTVEVIKEKSTIAIIGDKSKGQFDKLEFASALVEFTYAIIEYFEENYPLFVNSPIKIELQKLANEVASEYLGNYKPGTYSLRN